MTDARAAAPALALAGVSRSFGATVALHDVSLVVRPGTVHALLGENGAGKTTLMHIAYGMLRPDTGTIHVSGTVRELRSPADAIASGIGMVHQHFTLVPAMSVAENIALGGSGRYSARRAAQRVADIAALTGFALDAGATVESLPVGAQQRVEIAKALTHHARILILDEPTGVLAPAEIDELLRWLRAFVARGNAAVLITHKLREALAVADDVTVLRRGQMVLHGPAHEMSEATLTHAMIGGALAPDEPTAMRSPHSAPPVFRAESVWVADGTGRMRVRDASFLVAAGEIVGVAGVEGSGQRELLRALAGRLPLAAGVLDGPSDVGFVPEDRHQDAVMLGRSLRENVMLRGAGARRGMLDHSADEIRTGAMISAFDVRASGTEAPMRALSGGNQQKLVLARELAAWGPPPKQQHRSSASPEQHHSPASTSTPPLGRAVVLENPTRGLDVQAAADVHRRLRAAAADGVAVIVYSSDLDEVLSLATRVLVVYDGTVRSMAADRDAIGRAMLGLD